MKFGHQYETALANDGFPPEWVRGAIQYKYLKKCIKGVHRQLLELGLDDSTLIAMRDLISIQINPALTKGKDYFAATRPVLDSITEEFTPSLRILVDCETGEPLDTRLSPDTRAALQKLARHELVLEHPLRDHVNPLRRPSHVSTIYEEQAESRRGSIVPDGTTAKWVEVPLDSAKDFFDMLEPKLAQLKIILNEETQRLEDEILDLGADVENVVAPVREGFEAVRKLSYRDLYFWREMFRLYLEKPIFYRDTEQKRGAITFDEAKANLQEYDRQLRDTGLLGKMKTPQAKMAAQRFLDVNLQILKTLHFQEMNARAMTKIMKKFDKRTHLEGKPFISNLAQKYPIILSESKGGIGGFADSIARDLQLEMGSKVLAVVPQLDDWICPVCYGMAWRPVNLGCCRSVFCISCIIHLQDTGMKKCPMCNAETVLKANGNNIDFDTMDFLGIFFPMEVKKRQAENVKAQLIREHGEDFVKPACTMM